MKIFDNLGESVIALIFSAAAAVVGAVGAFVLTIFVGARFFKGEMSYGFGLLFGPLSALVVGGAVSTLLFRKIRSL
jgi:hypothetical protein